MKMFFVVFAMMLASCQTRGSVDIQSPFVVGNQTIQFVGNMTGGSFDTPVSELKNRPESSKVEVYIDAWLSDPVAAYTMIDAMKDKNVRCYIEAAGGYMWVALQACNTRILSPSFQGMILTTVAISMNGLLVEDADKAVKRARYIENQLIEAAKTGTGLNESQIRELHEKVMENPAQALMANTGDVVQSYDCTQDSHNKTLTRDFLLPRQIPVRIVMTMCPKSRQVVEPKDMPEELLQALYIHIYSL